MAFINVIGEAVVVEQSQDGRNVLLFNPDPLHRRPATRERLSQHLQLFRSQVPGNPALHSPQRVPHFGVLQELQYLNS